MKERDIIETERLILKTISEEDSGFAFELFNTPKWLKYIGDRNVKSVSDATNYIQEKLLLQHKRIGYSTYVLIEKSADVRIGTCGLYDRDGLEGIDIGFALFPEYEQKGFAFEAANKLLQVAFKEFGLTEISAITRKDNFSSQKLLEKLGLKLIGKTCISDDDEELLLYKINKLDE